MAEIKEIVILEVPKGKYVELLKKEMQLDLVKKIIQQRTCYNNYMDISDLKTLLDIKE